MVVVAADRLNLWQFINFAKKSMCSVCCLCVC